MFGQGTGEARDSISTLPRKIAIQVDVYIPLAPVFVKIKSLFTVCISTENQNQAGICPFALHEVSVAAEPTLGHLP